MRGTDGGNGHKPLHWRSEKLAKDRQQQCKRAQEALKNYSSPKLEVMILADLEIDEEYQRARTEAKVHKLRADFNPNACQPLAVSKRSDGKLFCVDGQHRSAALQELGFETWNALLYKNLNREEEAAMWCKLNTGQSKPKATERFKARIKAAEPEALAIKALVEKAGFSVHTQRGIRGNGTGGITPGIGGEITAVEALERVYRRNKAIGLTDTLSTIEKAWPDPDEANRLQRLIILGIANVLHAAWAPKLNRERLIRTLKKSTPGTWIGRAMGERGDSTPAQCFAVRVKEFYNKGAPKRERL